MADIFNQFLEDLQEYTRKTKEVLQQAVADGHISQTIGDQLELNADERVIRYLEFTRREMDAYFHRFDGWDERLL